MPRLQIDIPEKVAFSTTYKIVIGDINYGGHLDNSRFLGIAHESRLRFFQSLGYSEIDLAGVSTIMADAQLIFKAEGHQGDELRIDMGIDNFTSSGFELFYHFFNLTSGKEMAKVKTSIVCFDYSSSSVKRVPESFKSKFSD